MSSTTQASFLGSLFDFKLKHFITLRVLRVIYTILTVLISLAGVILLVGALLGGFGGSGGMRILAVVLVPLGTLFYLIIVRLWVEFLANLYRIGDNTDRMVENISN